MGEYGGTRSGAALPEVNSGWGKEVVLPLVQVGAQNCGQGGENGSRLNGEMWDDREGDYKESHRSQRAVSGRSP